MALITIGLASVQVADILGDGGTGTTFAALGYTYENTCKFTEADPEETSFYVEEVDDPVETSTKAGDIKLNFSIANPDVDTLVSVFGGKKTGGNTWEAPASKATIEKSIKITPKKGLIFTVCRANMVAKLNADFSRKGLFLIEIACTVLAPTKTAEPKLTAVPVA